MVLSEMWRRDQLSSPESSAASEAHAPDTHHVEIVEYDGLGDDGMHEDDDPDDPAMPALTRVPSRRNERPRGDFTDDTPSIEHVEDTSPKAEEDEAKESTSRSPTPTPPPVPPRSPSRRRQGVISRRQA